MPKTTNVATFRSNRSLTLFFSQGCLYEATSVAKARKNPETPRSASQGKRHIPLSPCTASQVPSSPPSFSLRELRQAIPPHCFHRSVVRSFLYLLVDLLLAAALATLAWKVGQQPSLPLPLQLLFWPLYWFFQGAVGTGLWVIAHECGHQAFSTSGALNDAVGFVLHSLLLAPYFSWKYSHARHHRNTGSVAKDEVFLPEVAAEGEELEDLRELLRGTPFYRAVVSLGECPAAVPM